MYEVHDADGLSWRVRPAGPGAAVLEADAPPSPELAKRLAERRAALWAVRPRSVHDIVPSYTSLLAEFRAGANRAEVARWLATPARPGDPREHARHVITVRYGDGADVDDLEARLRRPWSEIVRLHAAAAYTVAFIGFTPGFPYLLGLPDELHLPRRPTPRANVPAGAVAIAGGHGGIYPRPSPGGWWVLGRSDVMLFDPHQPSPAKLAAGDEVAFVASAESPAAGAEAPTAVADAQAARTGSRRRADVRPLAAHHDERRPVFEVLEVWPGAATLQAAPRWGVAQHGLAQSGPLDPHAYAAARDILGDVRGAAMLELTVPMIALRALAATTVVVTGGGAQLRVAGRDASRWRGCAVAAGETLELVPAAHETGATAYVAVAGGLAALAPPTGHPDLVQSDSTDVRAGLGGFGRALAAGDVLVQAGPAGSTRPWFGRPRYPSRALLRLHPGLQHEPVAFETLLASRFTVFARDRMGARLAGPPVVVSNHDVRSQGVPWGAVQVPADGMPTLLLSDRGRTGGYAVPAIVDPRDLWQLAQARPGSEVWFVPSDAW